MSVRWYRRVDPKFLVAVSVLLAIVLIGGSYIVMRAAESPYEKCLRNPTIGVPPEMVPPHAEEVLCFGREGSPSPLESSVGSSR